MLATAASLFLQGVGNGGGGVSLTLPPKKIWPTSYTGSLSYWPDNDQFRLNGPMIGVTSDRIPRDCILRPCLGDD